MGLSFVNRLNEKASLDYYKGESIADVLTRNHIPISSVLTTHNNIPISENALIEDNEEYISALIEGYDIDSILKNVYTREQTQANYIKNRITFKLDGSLLTEHIPMSVDDVVSMVEENIQFAIQNYNMISKGERVYVYVGCSGSNGGYNGGGDAYWYRDENQNIVIPWAIRGGGASDIRLGGNTTYHRVLVAAGGGGAGASGTGGPGDGVGNNAGYGSQGEAATMTSGGNYSGTWAVGAQQYFANGGYVGAGGGGW